MEHNNVYFASPWFTPEQEEREERLKAKLRSLGFDVWSPKEQAVVGTVSNWKTRQKIFDGNCDAIESSDIVFAVTDGKDMGTIWEAGFAYGINKLNEFVSARKIVIVYYCETLNGGKFNLMLAQSGNIVIDKFEDLDMLSKLIEEQQEVFYNGLVE